MSPSRPDRKSSSRIKQASTKNAHQIEEETARLQAVIDALPMGLWVADATGKMVFINDKARAIYAGTAPYIETVEEYSQYKVWWPDTGKRVAAEEMPMARSLKGERIDDLVLDFERFDGTLGTQMVFSAPVRRSDGAIIGSIGLVRDITDHKQMEKSLRQSEERFRSIFEKAPMGICIGDAPGYVVECNTAFQEMLGYTKEELKGISFKDYTYPEDLSVEQRLIEELLSGKRDHYEIEKRYVRKDGRTIWVRLVDTLLGSQKDATVYAMALAQDVTEQRRMEEELRQSEERYKELVETSNSIIMRTDKDLNITYVNEYGLKFFGYTAEELLGKNVIGTTIPEKDERGRDLAAMARELTRRPGKFKTNFHQNMRKNGELVWVSWTNHVKQNPDGSIEILSIGNDISEVKKAEEALRHNEEQYRQLFENMNEAFSLVAPVYDDQGRPVDWRFLDANPAFAQMTGFPLDAVIDHLNSELFPGAERIWIENVAHVAETGEPASVEAFSELTGRWYAINYYSPRPKVTAMVACDVTDQKRVAEELRLSEERQRALFDALPSSVFAKDLEGRYILCNRMAAIAAGMDSNESYTPGRAGGLPFAGPSKGPDRKREKKNRHNPHDSSHLLRIYGKSAIPQLSNCGSPPAEPGAYLFSYSVEPTPRFLGRRSASSTRISTGKY